MLIGLDTFLGNIQTFRVLWLKSRTGSGKTALAFRLAYELFMLGKIRYILSNCASPWVDDPADVVLRDGQFVDAVLIMDEAGLFMDSSGKAKKYLAYMRKMNIILLMPTVLAPAMIARYFTVKRVLNLEVVGLPVWVYRTRLFDGDEFDLSTFIWTNPSEVFGCYDTAGFPSDDKGLENYLLKWRNEAAQNSGYERIKSASVGGGFKVVEDEQASGDGESGLLEGLRGVVAAIEDSAGEQSDAVSVFLKQSASKRRR